MCPFSSQNVIHCQWLILFFFFIYRNSMYHPISSVTDSWHWRLTYSERRIINKLIVLYIKKKTKKLSLFLRSGWIVKNWKISITWLPPKYHHQHTLFVCMVLITSTDFKYRFVHVVFICSCRQDYRYRCDLRPHFHIYPLIFRSFGRSASSVFHKCFNVGWP